MLIIISIIIIIVIVIIIIIKCTLLYEWKQIFKYTVSTVLVTADLTQTSLVAIVAN